MVRFTNWATPEDVAALKGRPRRKPGEMNKGELAYANHLQGLKAAGLVRSWAFEHDKLRLGLRCYLTPDFTVVMADGSVEHHEVKGRKGRRYHVREDAMIKLRVAADRYRDRTFVVVWPLERGVWGREVIRSTEHLELTKGEAETRRAMRPR